MDLRIGNGIDIHNLIDGKSITLGGVIFTSKQTIQAHSDGDIIIHSIINAILGALNLGDIGLFFNDKDFKNKNKNSKEMLEIIFKKTKQDFVYNIFNIDITLIANDFMINENRLTIINSLNNLIKPYSKNVMINIKGTRWEKVCNQISCNTVLLLEINK